MTTTRVLTPAGRGAIAVVEVAGPDACRLVDRAFEPARGAAIEAARVDTLRFGAWREAARTPHGESSESAEPGEEVVVVRTGPTRVEVHCHGGVAASERIVASLVDAGATRRDESGDMSLEADALRRLRDAPTERVAGVLLDQAAGALRRALRRVASLLEADDARAAVEAIDQLLATERIGRRLTEPWRVVLAGEPNVGKSSLVNALVGFERAIVYDQPGTTRDVITTDSAVRGWPVALADTAGIRATPDPLESAGAELARRALGGADVVVLVGEACGWGDPAAEQRRSAIAAAAPHADVLRVANKADLAPAWRAPPGGVLLTSATTGAGVAALLTAIGDAIEPERIAHGQAVLCSARQAERLRDARSAVEAGDPARAAAAVQALLSAGLVAPIGES